MLKIVIIPENLCIPVGLLTHEKYSNFKPEYIGLLSSFYHNSLYKADSDGVKSYKEIFLSRKYKKTGK